MLKKRSFRIEKTLDNNRGAWIYQLKGKFVGSQECYDFLESARDRISWEAPNVVLLMAGVTLINSTGIGMIAALLTSANNKSGELFLVSASDSALRQLKVTHLWDYLKAVDDLEELPKTFDR